MQSAVIVLNFGEPEAAEPAAVKRFLERIFRANAGLEEPVDPAAADRRSSELAARRAPALVAEYTAIGGSPLNAQTRAQAAALERELRRRGREVPVQVGMQFGDPGIHDAVAAARAAGARRVVGLPLYPLCGPSTNLAALEALRQAVADGGGASLELELLGGWHVHPDYTALRADGIRRFLDAERLDLRDRRTTLVFAAHGTPLRYLRDGSAYDAYVIDHCRRVSDALEASAYAIGYQNHGNRPGVEWTGPTVEEVVAGVEGDRVVVVPVSFMQEQSETLYELDIELRGVAEGRGLGFHRVPVPHDDPRFAAVLAALVEPFLEPRDPGPEAVGWGACRCRPDAGVCCLTHALAPSPS